MAIYGNLIRESSLKSNIDKDYISKGKRNLSEFKKIKIDSSFINKHKKTTKLFKYIDPKDNGYCWIDGNNIVGVAVVDESRLDINQIWITAIEVTTEYKGYGLGKQLLDYAVKVLKGNCLSVAKDNQIALEMYKKYGFKISKESQADVDAGRKSVYFMYL